MTRSGQLVAECARVARCLYVNLLFRFRRVFGENGDEANGWEEDMLSIHVVAQWTPGWRVLPDSATDKYLEI